MSPQSSGQTPRRKTTTPDNAQPPTVARTGPEQGRSLSFEGAQEQMGPKGSEEEPQTDARDDPGQEGGGHHQPHDHGSKGRRFRVSGGFLLRNSILSSRVNNDHIETIKGDGEVDRGKQRAENGDIRVPKQRGAHRSLKPLVGSSPLVSEPAHTQNTENGGQVASNQYKRLSKLSTAGESSRSAGSGNLSSTGSGPSQQSEGGNLWRNSQGQETDPKQLVNLALNLSESRRRNASGALMRAPRDASGGTRVISSGQRSNGSPHGAVPGSLRQYLREPHRSPSHMSSRSGNSNKSRNNRAEPSKSYAEKDIVLSQANADTIDLNPNELFKASDATFARAEKARIALELGYEYRRLLQYLPVIPKAQQNKKPISRGKMHSVGSSASELGREYNPLQYIRNRRIRLREKKPLNPELNGWKDIDRVRAWIDTVKNDREFGISRVNDQFPLPPFDALEDLPIVVDGPDSSAVIEQRDAQGRPSRRPTSDWVVASSDLLADVYWLDQDHNLERIEDSQARKIKSHLEDAKNALSRKSKELSRQLDGRSSTSLNKDHAHQDLVEHDTGGIFHGHPERGHHLKAQRDKLLSEIEDPVRTHRNRWSKKLLRSRSLSSGSESDWSRKSQHYPNYEDAFNAVLEKQMMQMMAAETQDEDSNADDLSKKDESVQQVLRASRHHHHNESRSLRPRPASLHRMKMDNPPANRHSKSPQASSEDEKILHRRLSSHDYYQVPPKSPIPSLAPSIAIDSSPPKSPPSSTVSPVKRPFINRLGSFRRDRSRSVGRREASDVDAKDFVPSAPISRQITKESSSSNNPGSKSPYFNSALLSPTKGDQSTNKGSDARSVRHSREANMSESKLRGMFKGGRIAELVGNEMSRVGDRLRGRESSTSISQMAATDKPTQPSDDSEDDNDDSEHDSKLDRTSTNDSAGLVMANSNGSAKRGARLSTNERPKYYLSNLPSFRSPFVKDDRPAPVSKPDSDDHHITRQQKALKERGRSPNFDRLAPPKIDMRNISPSPSGTASRSQSPEIDRGRSRGSSSNRSLRSVQVADRRLNDVLAIPGRVAVNVRAPTGLAGLSTEVDNKDGRGSHREKKPWSISDHTISALPSTITKRDIARARALLLSSGIKAYEIARRQEDPPVVPSSMLQSLGDIIKHPVEPVPPSQEFVFAARALIADIENTNKTLRDAAESFSIETADGLHDRINRLDAHVNDKLTSLVRGAADDADAFGAELTTTHTLATRELNNSIDDILRIRRHRTRWLRRGGWTMVEWLVLGILWVAWFIAVIIRFIRGTVKGLVGTMRWLLWL